MRLPERAGFLGLAALVSAGWANAQSDVYDMDFAQLTQLQVTVASARADTVVDAPGVVSRYAAADLEKLGLRTLKDLLSFVPGFVLQDTVIGTTAVAVRGLSDGFNQKVLLLLDDVPYWMPTHSDAPLLGIPLEAIDHIEIVRGPASVMYGTNASAGLIRVVTKKRGVSKLALSGGAHGLVNGGGYWSADLGKDEYLDLSFERQRDNGYSARQVNAPPVLPGLPNAGQVNGAITRAERMGSVMLHYHRADFNLTLHAFHQATNGLGLYSSLANTNELTYQGALLHADYSWTLDRATTIKLYSDWNNFFIDMPVKNAIAPGVDGGAFVRDPRDQYRWRSGASLDWNPSAQINVLAGAEFERRVNQDYGTLTAGGLNVVLPANSSDETAVFAQADYTVAAWRFLAGARLVAVKNSEATQRAFTPRAALVYKLDDTQSLKLLYSTGFNAPNALQVYASLPPVLSGDRTLKPETVATTELAYAYVRESQLLVANLYNFRGKNFIGRHVAPPIQAQYFNTPGMIRRWGGELDVQTLACGVRLYANLAYNHQGNRQVAGDQTAYYTPRLTLAGGASRRFAGEHIGGASLRYVGAHAGAGGLTLADLNYQFEGKRYELFATLRNLFDKELMQPDLLNFRAGRQVTGGDRRNLYAGVRLRF